uniref:SRCR domain-containing protein n=1 Tax=Panagrolaimus sp. PS1159 TaxID=55785 RepID=A0AC35G591_9BILA
MLPYQQQINYEDTFPDFKLIDGPTVRQGRLQVKFRDRWRGVCSALTNWTSTDTQVACKSMGYSDGAFYTWFRRNNDTYPFVMPVPGCRSTAKNLWDCQGFAKLDKIPLSENLCQGEDDIGLYCWGQPTFTGWAKHWKGLQIFNSPYHYVHLDPDMVSVARESNSRLEFLDIRYAGYDGTSHFEKIKK